MRDEGVLAVCDSCRELKICTDPATDLSGKALCYNCWHGWRETQVPFHVRNARGLASHAAFIPCVYLRQEAEARAVQLNNERPGEGWAAVQAPNWNGERIAHPGYLELRRRLMEARSG